jgi:hypothetical protein
MPATPLVNHDEAMNLGATEEAKIEVGHDDIGCLSHAAGVHLEERVKRELRRHHISERDRLVADTLCEVSFGLGLRSVKIPKLDVIGELTGLPRQHVYTTLKRLHDMRIVSVQPKQGVFLYTINANSESWKVAPRVALATILRGLETIRELNGVREEAIADTSENSAPGDKDQIQLFSVTDSVTVTNEAFPALE